MKIIIKTFFCLFVILHFSCVTFNRRPHENYNPINISFSIKNYEKDKLFLTIKNESLFDCFIEIPSYGIEYELTYINTSGDVFRRGDTSVVCGVSSDTAFHFLPKLSSAINCENENNGLFFYLLLPKDFKQLITLKCAIRVIPFVKNDFNSYNIFHLLDNNEINYLTNKIEHIQVVKNTNRNINIDLRLKKSNDNLNLLLINKSNVDILIENPKNNIEFDFTYLNKFGTTTSFTNHCLFNNLFVNSAYHVVSSSQSNNEIYSPNSLFLYSIKLPEDFHDVLLFTCRIRYVPLVNNLFYVNRMELNEILSTNVIDIKITGDNYLPFHIQTNEFFGLKLIDK